LATALLCAAALPVSASIPAPADFDGDGRADISRLTNTGVWEVDLSSNGFGSRDLILTGYPASAIPVPADYDGDGRADVSLKRDDGTWTIDFAVDGFGGQYAGFSGYGPNYLGVPVPADYDGDGRADLSIKAIDGTWFIDYAAQGGFGAWNAVYHGYGGTNAIPVPADYDGDGRADLSVWVALPGTFGVWYIDYAESDANGNTVFTGWNEIRQLPAYVANQALIPVPGDYDGDGRADFALRGDDGVWYIDFAANGRGQFDVAYPGYGTQNDSVPSPADYDGDGRADLSVKGLNGFWFIDFSANNFGQWNFVDVLAPPVKPYVYGVTWTYRSVSFRVRADVEDAPGHSAATQIRAKLVDLQTGVPVPGYDRTVAGSFMTQTFGPPGLGPNLQPGHGYCIVAIASNPEGNATGDKVCFVTQDGPPTH
jgi:hypothetical protein